MKAKSGINDKRVLAVFESGEYCVNEYGKVIGKNGVPANVTKRNKGFIVGLRDEDGVFYVSLPRAVLIGTAGLPPEGADTAVCLDADPSNTLADNLRWGTQSDARKAVHVAGKGVIPDNRGEKHGNSKLTDQQREAIIYARLHVNPPISVSVLAAEYKVSRSAITNLVARFLKQKAEGQTIDNSDSNHVVS